MSFPNASHPASPVPPFEVSLHRLDGAQALACVEALTDVLNDCVEGGASVSFMRPLTRERAGAFWRKVAESGIRDAHPNSGKWHKNGCADCVAQHPVTDVTQKSPPQVRREGPVR